MHTHNQIEADEGDQGIEFTWDGLLHTGREGGLTGEGPLKLLSRFEARISKLPSPEGWLCLWRWREMHYTQICTKMFLLGVSKQRRKRQGSWWPSRGHGESPAELLLNEKQKNSSNSHYSLRLVLYQQPQKSHAVSEKLIVLLRHLVLGEKTSLCFSVSWFSLGFQSIGHTIIIVILFCLMIDPSTFIK